jgi:hypothetical protein
MSKKTKIIRICKYCEKAEFDEKVEWLRSVRDGSWVCIPCYRERYDKDKLINFGEKA